MMCSAPFVIRRLGAADVALFRELLATFTAAFGAEAWQGAPPRDAWLRGVLSGEQFIALAALVDDRVVGGLAAYELRKFEREASEIYIYDLAVDAAHRRRGIATALIEALKPVAAARGADVIFVQADHGDDAAIALYAKLGRREDVLHFDIAVG